MAARKTFPPLRAARERFMEKTRWCPDTGCLLWTGGASGTGYGVFYVGQRKQQTAHTYALEKKLGRPITPGMEALHSCDTKLCVSWDHLSEGTHAENMADHAERGAPYRPSEHIERCAQGHEFTEENTRWATRTENGRTYRIRKCRACNRIYLAARRAAA